MGELTRKAFWLIAVGFLLTGKLCLFADPKSRSQNRPAPVQLLAKIVSVDLQRQISLVEVEGKIYLFSVENAKVSRQGKPVSLKDLIAGQLVTLLLSTDQQKLELLSIAIVGNGKPSQPAGPEGIADLRPSFPSYGNAGSPMQRDEVLQQPPSAPVTANPRATNIPDPHLIDPHPHNSRPDVTPFQ